MNKYPNRDSRRGPNRNSYFSNSRGGDNYNQRTRRISPSNSEQKNNFNTGTIAVPNDESELTVPFEIKQIRENNSTLLHGTIKRIEINCKLALKRFSVLVLDDGGLLTLGNDYNPNDNGSGWVDIRNWTGSAVKEGASGRTAKKCEPPAIPCNNPKPVKA